MIFVRRDRHEIGIGYIMCPWTDSYFLKFVNSIILKMCYDSIQLVYIFGKKKKTCIHSHNFTLILTGQKHAIKTKNIKTYKSVKMDTEWFIS